jgi:hypothetical protein
MSYPSSGRFLGAAHAQEIIDSPMMPARKTSIAVEKLDTFTPRRAA